MKKLVPYLIFGVVYFVLVFCAGAVIDAIHGQMANQVLDLLTPMGVAPLAILAARRSGCLSPFGIAIVTVFSTLAMYAIITSIYASLAARAGSSVSLLALAQLGGWSLAFSYLIYIAAPVLWLPFLRNRAV